MGWDGTHHRNRTREQFIQDELAGMQIVTSNWSAGTYFAAVRTRQDPSKVVALIVLVQRDGNYWMKKTMDEGCGPHYDGASLEVMQALSPVDELFEPGSYGNRYAREWRARQAQPTRGQGNGTQLQIQVDRRAVTHADALTG